MFDSESEDAYGHVAGDTILLVPLPELDAVTEPWLHASTSDGIDAHVTVLVPFLPEDRIDEGVLGELRRAFAGHKAFDLTFQRLGSFPETLYLVPEPEQPFLALTASVYERWPECPPYEGRFPDPVPHLTVVHAKGDDVSEDARRVLEQRLPVQTRATCVDLLCFDGRRWNLRERFPLAGDGVAYRELHMPGRLREPAQDVIRSASAFQRYWDEAHAQMSLPAGMLLPPDVDWTREIVLVVALGPRPTLQYRVYVSLKQDQGGLRVLVQEAQPERNSVQSTALGYPAVLLAVATDITDITFHVQEPVTGYQPTVEQSAARRTAYELWQRTRQGS